MSFINLIANEQFAWKCGPEFNPYKSRFLVQNVCLTNVQLIIKCFCAFLLATYLYLRIYNAYFCFASVQYASLEKIHNTVLQQLSTFCESIFLVFPSLSPSSSLPFLSKYGVKSFHQCETCSAFNEVINNCIATTPKATLALFFSEKTQ